MFTLYCDDSGTHTESPIAVAACFVARDLQWTHFAKDWKDADDAEHFGVFHMADFVARKEQFALPEWQDDEKRERTIKRLISVINIRRQIGFFASVEKAGYDAEVPLELRDRFKLGNNHYTFAARMCMAKVLKWRIKYGHGEPIEFVFDQLAKGKGEINAVFEQALDEGDEKALAHGITREKGWSFRSKSDYLPLQAADILAWETLHFMRNVYLPANKGAPRKSYSALLNGPMEPGYHNQETLREFIAHIKDRQMTKKSKT